MATSGTQGQTSVDTTSIIEHAYRRCGKLASTISSELQLSARENLYFLLSDLANRGLSLWCIQKSVIGVVANQSTFTMPPGTVDVLNCSYRTKTDLAGTVISGAGWQGLDLGTGVTAAVYTVSIQFSVPTNATLIIEYSTDSISWNQSTSFPSAVQTASGSFICADVDNSTLAQFWRVRDTSGTLPAVSYLDFAVEPYETPMGRLSNDDYASYPNKAFTVPVGSKSLQYWYDKQVQPRIWIWPQSAGNVDQIVVWTQRHIQDVGALTNTLDVPQRWLESIILTLACRCALELPAGELPEGRYALLKDAADEHMAQAEDSENDGSPIRISPNIRGYTR